MKKIKERRAKINISQEELAKKMGVAQSTVSMWETGEVTPPTKRLCELAHTLNCTVDELINDSQPNTA